MPKRYGLRYRHTPETFDVGEADHMNSLLRRPSNTTGKVHDITPASAGWSYVGFELFRLSPGENVEQPTGDNEVILVLVEGKADITGGGLILKAFGNRLNVFEQLPPSAIYLPNDMVWSVTAVTDCTLAVCAAPGKGNYAPCEINGIEKVERGSGTNLRHIYPIAMEERDIADSLLVTEVFTPAGHWSSYPPHRHDEDNFPEMTYLEETYYHRLNPAQGFGIQRVFTEDGALDETMAVHDGDVVLVPKGHHPCAAPYGYEMYYLNVMAGPLRKWRFQNHPDHDWIVQSS